MRNITLRTFCAFVLQLFAIWIPANSQTIDNGEIEKKFEAFSKLLSPEKLYLHTDRDVYCAGDTIWFKGYLVNNSYLSEFPESNYIYVELIANSYVKNLYKGREEAVTNVIRRVKIKRNNGILQGYVSIPVELNTNYAILRGYTYWNLNFPPEYLYSKNIKIVNPMKDQYIDMLVKKKEKDRNLFYKLGAKYPFIKNPETTKDIDCQFFAESGRFVCGQPAVAAFKAVAENGLGEKVKGTLYNDSSEVVATFESNNLGFGKITIAKRIQNRTYYAMVEDNRGVIKKVPLPPVEKKGIVINSVSDSALFTVNVSCSKDFATDSLRFILHNGSEIFYDKSLENNNITFILQKEKMPYGITDAAIVDIKGNIYASRQLFTLPENTCLISFENEKSFYPSREKAAFKISLKNSGGHQEGGNFSVSITDESLAPYIGMENNIISYMLLSGEIKGYIENPQSYFDQDIPLQERRQAIDLLMLTQGWKYYDLSKILNGKNDFPFFGKEYIQTINGKVRMPRKKRSSIVTFIAPSINFAAMGQIDSTGYFELKDVDFPDSTRFIVNANSLNGRRRLAYIPTIMDDAIAPMLKYYHRPDSVRYSPSLGTALMEKYYYAGGESIYELEPVYVTAHRRIKAIPGLSPMSGYLFKKEQLRSPDDLLPYKNSNLVDYIVSTCPGLRRGNNGTILCRGPRLAGSMQMGTPWVPVRLYINGMYALYGDAEMLVNMSVGDIESMAYLTGMDAGPFGDLTMEWPPRSVIMILTHLNSITKVPRNITSGYPKGWQVPAKLYTPKYDVIGKNSIQKGTDRRSTVYWNPDFRIGESGNADFSFFTSDGDSDYTIIVEGIADDGTFLFKKQTIHKEQKQLAN